MAKPLDRLKRRGALAVLIVLGASPVPAGAATVNLVCAYDTSMPALGYGPTSPVSEPEFHVAIDTDRRTITTNASAGPLNGPYDATISDSSFQWTIPAPDADHITHRLVIDRSTGTVSDDNIFRGESRGKYSGKCRLAAQKF